ncbi:amino acid/polyamine transporter I, partial [Podospora australis]
GLLAYVVFSFLFITFFNSATNGMQTGRSVLLRIDAHKVEQDNSVPEVNRDLVRFIVVFVLSVLSLLQYFSPNAGRMLNRAFIVVKIATLIALVIVGGNTAAKRGTFDERRTEWATRHEVRNSLSFAKALLAVLFSFEGWENATFVAGEIPRNRPHILQRGFIWAVMVVGILYLCVVSVVLDAITWEQLKSAGTNLSFAQMLTGNGTAARRGWAIMTAISSLGSLNAIIYTFSRVKQAIGQADILPWSKLWKKDHYLQRGQAVLPGQGKCIAAFGLGWGV